MTQAGGEADLGGERDTDQWWDVLGEGEQRGHLSKPSRSPQFEERQDWRGTTTPETYDGAAQEAVRAQRRSGPQSWWGASMEVPRRQLLH